MNTFLPNHGTNRNHPPSRSEAARATMRLTASIVCLVAALGIGITSGTKADASEHHEGVTTAITQSTTPAGLTSSQFDQLYHYNTPQGFLNDIQSIWKGRDGYYHFMYIQNPMYKHDGDGTVWYHVKTKDFVHYTDVGVSIPKFNGIWFSMATGTIIDNSQGLFTDLPEDALVAYFTSYIEGVQKQFIAYSTDEGASFKPYRDSAIMSAPNDHTDFRDPYMSYDSASKTMMMYLAEGDKIGTYASKDGITFSYVGATILNAGALNGKDLGTVECPNIKTLRDPATGEEKTILFFGANGYQYGSTTGTYYMVGHLDDNRVFVTEQQPKRVDDGSDYYGANFMQDGDARITSLAWMGNWGYSAKDISDDNGITYKLGSISLARHLTLSGSAGNYTLDSAFVEPTALFGKALTGTASSADGNKELLKISRPSAQNAKLTFTNTDGDKAVEGHITITLEQADSSVTIIYDADAATYTATRSTTRLSDKDGVYEYTKVIAASAGSISPRSLTMHILQDQSSVEFTIPGSGKTYTMLRLSTDTQSTIRVSTDGRNALSYSLNTIGSQDDQPSPTPEPTADPTPQTPGSQPGPSASTGITGTPTGSDGKQTLQHHGQRQAQSASTRKLGNTGSAVVWPLVIGTLLLVAGIGILRTGRRPQRSRPASNDTPTDTMA
jgi:levanase